MPRDPRVDAYIEKSAEFARPILSHLREVVLSVDPEISESIKWSMPAFMWRGKQIANMAAFKQHAAFGFWKREGEETAGASEGMGQFGKLTKVSDLPPNDVLVARTRAAMELVAAGAKTPRATPQPKIPLAMPSDFAEALDKAGARANFDAFPPGAQREYLEWILEAKQPATRTKRISEASAWISEGKKRNWKYER